jgi:hypothetical protein
MPPLARRPTQTSQTLHECGIEIPTDDPSNKNVSMAMMSQRKAELKFS